MKYFCTIFFVLFFFAFPSFAAPNASLFLSPSIGTYPIGEVFTVSVNINTNGEMISTAEGNIAFNNSELEVAAISRDGSILTSWDTEPSFSNEEGIVHFSGLTAEGFTGENGKILSISFKALKNKQSTVHFATGAAIIAADGLGTNILSSMDAGRYELTPKEVVPSLVAMADASSTPITEATSTPPVPFIVTSSTHSDSTRSYATTTAILEWKWEDDTSSVAFSFDDKPTTTPKKTYTSPVTKKVFKDLKDGVYFFHIKRTDETGTSTLVHYRVGIDTVVPESFTITEAALPDAYGFNFTATDSGSGIEKYDVRIDEGTENSWIDDGGHVYKPSGLSSGTHTIKAKAIDLAGNFIEQSFPFTVAVVDVPEFSEKPKDVTVGDLIILRFKSMEKGSVRVVSVTDTGIKSEGIATKDADGTFSFPVVSKAVKGTYTVYAIGIVKGVESAPSEKIVITVRGGIVYYAKTAFVFTKAQAAKIFFVVLGLFILLYGFSKLKRKDGEYEENFPEENNPRHQQPTQEYRNPMQEIRPSGGNKEPVRIVAEQNTVDNVFQVRIGKKQ